MKRLLTLLTLMVIMLLPNMAQAERFYFGSDANDQSLFLDDKTGMGNLAISTGNFKKLDAMFGGGAGHGMSLKDFDYKNLVLQYSAVAYSEYAHGLGNLVVSSGGTTLGDASAPGNLRLEGEYKAKDLTLSWYNGKGTQTSRLSDLIKNSVVYVLDKDATLSLAGAAPVTYEKGTIFFGFVLPGSNNFFDVIMAAGPFTPAAVPVPAAVWLMGTGLAGLVALRRKTR